MRSSANQHRDICISVVAAAIWVVLGAGPTPVYAQKAAAVTSVAIPADQENSVVDAQRGAFDRFLDSHPEIEGDVYSDPERTKHQEYLQRHTELQAFLESHPLVKADPRAFISKGRWKDLQYHESGTHEVLGFLVPSSVFICFMLAVLWVIRTVVENRRWNRSCKMQEEVHTKLIEKFASGPELGAYMQSDAVRRLLEWTPMALEPSSRSMPIAANRIIRSAQAGLVLLLAGLGLLSLTDRMAADSTPPLMVLGTLGLTIGIGFILSAVMSYGLSKHLGLIGGATTGTAAEPKG